MASSAAENRAVINCDDNTAEIEVSQISNNSLLNSLFEESQAEDGDDERLRSFIQSLEAEIDPSATKGHNHPNLDDQLEMDDYNDQKDYHQLYSGSENLGSCCGQLDHATSSHNLECFGWNVDMEMSPSSVPSNEISSSWYKNMTGTGDGAVVFEFEGMGDYSQFYYYGAPLEEHGQSTSLWQ